jgi:sugar phosphate isomerase/epimerase
MRAVEFDWRWLVGKSDAALADLASSVVADQMAVIVSFWLSHAPGETLDEAWRVGRAMGARLVRLHLSPVLEGARASHGRRWDEMVAHARRTLVRDAPGARDAGLRIGLENHQDFGSEELLQLAEAAGDHVGLVLDTGNPFAVGEDPLAFTRRAAHRIWHLHLKDYRAQFTAEGYRLIRCALGEGAVPLAEIGAVVESSGREVTASIEPAALAARHIRLFTRDWWRGYPPRDAAELGEAIGRLRLRCLADDEDGRTPWERDAPDDEVQAYELDHLRQSVAHVRTLGWL